MTEKNVNVLMDTATHERLRKAAYETRKSMSRIAREALVAWLDKYEAESASGK